MSLIHVKWSLFLLIIIHCSFSLVSLLCCRSGVSCACAGTASRDLLAPAATRRRMVEDKYTNEFAAYAAPPSQRAKRAKEAAPCHDFDADRAAGRTSKVYDINGIVSIFCRQV